jgi:hypothetical protein
MMTTDRRFYASLGLLAGVFLCRAECRAQIPGLCNTGETHKEFSGCTGALVTPNPPGGGTNTDGNWGVEYFASTGEISKSQACKHNLISAYVDTPNPAWMPDSASTASEWITPYDGEGFLAPGYYIYVTLFQVNDSPAPIGFTINGQLASDNAMVGIYMETPAGSGNCELVAGQTFPVDPIGSGDGDFQLWWPFSFTNPGPIAVASPTALYFVVHNDTNADSPTGLRVEFFSSSSFTY